jgi:hypothetical protein
MTQLRLRQRRLHPALFGNTAFASLSPEARLLAIGLWTAADKAEAFPWRPVALKIALFPVDDVDVPELLSELLNNGVVRRFGEIGVINRRLFVPPEAPSLDVPQSVWQRLRSAVFVRDGEVCVYCGDTPDDPECDHVFPVSRGGRSVLENLATACPACNRAKGPRTPEEWRA